MPRKHHGWILPACLLLGAAACGTEDVDPLPSVDGGSPGVDAGLVLDGGPSSDGSIAPDAGPDPSDPYFEPSNLLEVEIELGAEDWDMLRSQAREFPGILIGESCLDEPFSSPYTYFPAKVTVDGRSIEPVGLRKKGFLGSLSEVRPSLKIKFDQIVPGQLLDGMERLTLNNGQQDPSLLRTCIAYRTFDRAGVPAPRCNFAHVLVNGEDMGVYVHVEEIKKPFLRRHFDDDEGLLYEGTLSDFRPEWLGTFEKKTNEEIPDDRTALTRVAAALEQPDAQLVEALEAVLDVDAFITFWATEVLLGHWDGYAGNTNNFFVYFEPLSERFYFLPWGPDAVLSESPFLPQDVPNSVLATGFLARRLYEQPDIRARYVARMAELLDNSWDEVELQAYISQAQTLIRPYVLAPQRFTSAVTELRGFVDQRRFLLEPELEVGGLDWTVPLRGSPCWSAIGEVYAELETTWGTHPADNPLVTGTGTITGTFMDTPFAGITVGGAAGLGVSPDDQGQAVFLVPALIAGNAVVVLYIVTPPELVYPGSSIPIDFGATRSAILYAPQPGAQLQLIGWVGSGNIEIIEGDTTNGSPIRLVVDADILGQGAL